MSTCPNQFPTIEPCGARLAIVGEFADADAVHFQSPITGEAGRLLDGALGHVGIARSSCYVGNVVQHLGRGDFNFAWDGVEVQSGIEQLRADLERFKPTMVLCLGAAALHLMLRGNVAPRRRGKDIDWPCKIGDWRGSLFTSTWFAGVKCLAAQHPSAVLRDYSLQAYYRTGVGGLGDMERLRSELKTPELVLDERRMLIHTPSTSSLQIVLSTLKWLRDEKKLLSCDLEGHPGDVTAIAFAPSASMAYVFPLADKSGVSLWEEESEVLIWQGLKELLEDPLVPIGGMNFASYDCFVLAWTYGIVVRNLAHDAILAWWELMAELPKGLKTQVSLLTRHPFYKPDREDGQMVFASDEEFYRYNGLDACLTYECIEKELGLMSEGQRRHYQFNVELLPALRFMMTVGIRFDKDRATEEQEKAGRGAMELQAQIDRESCLSGHWEPDLVVLQDLWVAHGTWSKLTEDKESLFAALCLRCLGGKNPRVKVEMVEERWQPMKWNGKRCDGPGKWVKAGKVLSKPVMETLPVATPEGVEYTWHTSETAPPPCGGIGAYRWLKPMHRTIERLQPFTPATLADCEPHVLESKRREWKRVKKVWKELIKNYDERTKGRVADSSLSSGDEGAVAESGCSGAGRASEPTQNALLGELSTLLGLAVNIGSTNEGGNAQRFLYETCGLPRIYKDERTGRLSRETEGEWKRRTGRAKARATVHNDSPPEQVAEPAKASKPAGKKISTDQNAIDKLYAETQDVRVLWCLQQRRLKKVVTDLEKEIDDDGRIRASISLVKETGRMAASESPTGTGTNLQAWNKDLRHICVADSGCVLGQCDLEGADSWTVAAECAALGDGRMLEDLRAGMKPAKGLCYGYFDVDGYAKGTPQELMALLKQREQPGWLYPGAKSCTHGSSYQMGWKTMIDTVLKFSMADLPLELKDSKPIMLTKAQVEKLQGAFLRRYPGIQRWHEKEGRDLLSKGWIETSTGHVRRIYGRKKRMEKGRMVADHSTLKEVLASKPQYYTTYAVKLMLHRLWHDPENRRADGSLEIAPLLPVHDSLAFSFAKDKLSETKAQLAKWFNNTITIAGQQVVIPHEFCYGNDWSCKEKA